MEIVLRHFGYNLLCSSSNEIHCSIIVSAHKYYWVPLVCPALCWVVWTPSEKALCLPSSSYSLVGEMANTEEEDATSYVLFFAVGTVTCPSISIFTCCSIIALLTGGCTQGSQNKDYIFFSWSWVWTGDYVLRCQSISWRGVCSFWEVSSKERHIPFPLFPPSRWLECGCNGCSPCQEVRAT